MTSYVRNKNHDDEIRKNQEKANNSPSYRCAAINKTIKSLLKEYETEIYSTYSDLKAVFIERFNRTLSHIINKPRFINGHGNCLNILNDAVVTYNDNKDNN